MIQSILDQDLYKISMVYCYLKHFPFAQGRFEFKDRGQLEYNQKFVDGLKLQLYKLADLKLSKEEKEWCIKNIPYIPPFVWEWLSAFRFNPELLTIKLVDGKVNIIAEGNIVDVSMWEIPLLATFSEYYYKYFDLIPDMHYFNTKLDEKIALSNENKLYFSEFGTRRRFSSYIHDLVCKKLSERALCCTGTSNMYYAMKYNMKPIGTMAHEMFSFCGSQYGVRHANYILMEKWIEAYDGNLGIALTDTFTSPVFFNNFSMKHAKLFDGIRQDSGDPYKFVNLAIQRYQELGIDPMSKTIIFSDSLDFKKALDIQRYCHNRIKCAFGIGTNLTNDVNVDPMNIVMKLTACKMTPKQPWRGCIKLSDVEGKHMGNEHDIEQAKRELNL